MTQTPEHDLILPLTSFLSTATRSPVTLHHAAPLAGGASRDMWLLDMEIDDERGKFVLRRDPPTQMFEQALSRAHEFAVMTAAYQAGVRVARPRWLCEDPSVLGSPFFIMEYVEGVGIGRKVVTAPELAHARAVLPEQLAAQLAIIHQIPPELFPFLPRPPENRSPAQIALDQAYAILDDLGVHDPTFEFCLRWAERHMPVCDRMTFLHGDYRIGNLIINADGLAAVADWEFCHVGDPDEELGYPCMRDWRFGNGRLRFGGLSDRETFLQAYERHSGRTVSRDAVDFWELVGNIRWGIICLSQANRHLSGREPSVELASLGRRSAEMALESVLLIRGFEEGEARHG
jgi:aminoglycoside phosphotransferase (APT) family kinase protein